MSALSGSNTSRDKEPVDVHHARTQAWWISMVAGQMDQAHPVYGTDLQTTLDRGVLTLKGALPTQADIGTLLVEAEQFRGQGINEIRSELSVADTPDESGLLVQTLLSAFEGPEEAALAADFVVSHIPVDAVGQRVVRPGDALAGLLPDGFMPDAESALGEGRVLLILTVDETAAFAARQVLEEETRSLWTQALPPQPAPDAPSTDELPRGS